MVATTTLEQKLERQIIENIHHEPLSDLEKVEAIKRLTEMKGCDQLQAACDIPYANSNLLSLVDAPKEVKDLIEEKPLPSIAGEN